MATQNCQTLTKLILNNKIVQMRKNARRSRAHNISKLCREIKKLKSKKGTDEQKGKNARKAERFIEQISLMKKIPDDEISRFALTNEKPFLQILNVDNESSRNKALARLISSKCISNEVKKFRETYIDWKISLEPLLSTLGKKYKHEKLEKNNISSRKFKYSNTMFKKTFDSITKLDKDEESSKCSESVVLCNSSGMWLSKNMVQDPGQNITSIVNQKNAKKFGREEKLIKERFSKEKPLMVVDRTTTDHKNKCQMDIKMRDSVVDPFFATKDNKEYLSISMKNTQNRFENDVKKIINDCFDDIAKERKLKSDEFPISDQQKINNSRNRTRKESFELHPSWAAKKNPFNSGILKPEQFINKKIKFDIDELMTD